MTDYNVHVWRQSASDKPGYMERHRVTDITDDMSFLEMLDTLNESLQVDGKEPIAFDHDCREGICGRLFPSDKRSGAWTRNHDNLSITYAKH